ncbi:MAG: hypothetical protein HY855_09160 [Burkholderiales bacterium]|nr:hypothetical protein [Burkholderiales bacterium]
MACTPALLVAAPGPAGRWARAAPWRSRSLLSCSLAMLVALQIHLARGAPAAHLNVYISFGVLLVYQDWRVIVRMAAALLVLHVAADQLQRRGLPVYYLPQPDASTLLLHASMVVLQAALLARVAHALYRANLEGWELALLVQAMNRGSRISLNLDVLRADTPAGQRLRAMQQRMADELRHVRDCAGAVQTAAHRVADCSAELCQRTESSTQELRDSAMCLDQISIIARNNHEASNAARAMSEQAQAAASEGETTIADVVRTMHDIEASSRQVTELLATIDAIAAQTNILSLNAAVEAARSGEHGRGFAVVAAEVRALAQRSATTARDARRLVTRSTDVVERGITQVGQAGRSMAALVQSVQQVGAMFTTILSDASDSAQGMKMVTQSMEQLGQVTQQNLSVAERSANAAQDLQTQVSALAKVLDAFDLGTGEPVFVPDPPPQPMRTHRVAGAAAPPGTLSPATGGQRPNTVDFF